MSTAHFGVAPHFGFLYSNPVIRKLANEIACLKLVLRKAKRKALIFSTLEFKSAPVGDSCVLKMEK